MRRPSNAESDKDSSRFDVSSAFGVDVEPEGAGAARGRELGERQGADGAVQFRINSPTEDGSRSGTPRVEGPREVPTEYQPLDGSDPDVRSTRALEGIQNVGDPFSSPAKRPSVVICLGTPDGPWDHFGYPSVSWGDTSFWVTSDRLDSELRRSSDGAPTEL